jgi:two-component system sensor histidine kinase VicK
MQKEFIDVAAHELRTPIQPILGLTQIVRSKVTEPQQQALLDVTMRNAKRLQRLADAILDVTKIESKSLNLKKERFNLNDVITTAINDAITNDSLLKKEKDAIKLEYRHQDVFVEADKERIIQVISNLLSNAIKFTQLRGTISISLQKKDDNNNSHVVISMKDTGSGIDPEILPKLFTKFASKSYQGTGLGLFISKSIVEAHGGRIWAENNADGKGGAIFYFSLP